MNKEKLYHKIEVSRRIVILPFRIIARIINIILLPILLPMEALMTDWNDEWDRDYFFRQIKKLWTFKL